jgi:hypothetical protein
MKISGNYIILSALAGILAAIIDLSSMFIFGICRLGYHSMNDTVSSLGASASPASDQISAIWIIVGILLIFFGLGFGKEFSAKGRFARIASWMIVLYGMGEGIGSGLFKANGPTISGMLHELFGSVGVIAILFLPLIMQQVITKKENPSFRILSHVVFVSGIICLILFLFRFSGDETNFISVYKGLWQRLFILITYIYLLCIALLMIKKRLAKNDLTLHL